MTATIAVAVAAILVSAAFNVLVLRRSSKTLELAERTYKRTEDRYQADRREARNAILRDALIDVSIAVTIYNQANAWYVKLINNFVADQTNEHIAAINQHDIDKLRPAVQGIYRAVTVVNFLTAEQRLTTITGRIEKTGLQASNLVNKLELTDPGQIRDAVKKFEELRLEAAKSCAELISVARELIPPP